MTLNDELSFAFYEARKGNSDSLNYLVDYFIGNVKRQLMNINLNDKDYNKKLRVAYQVVFRNINICYDANTFVNKSLNDLKKVIYLNDEFECESSKSILNREEENIKKIITGEILNKLHLPIVYREVARMYYFEQKSIKELSQIFKCSETIIYSRLRKVANAILSKDFTYKEILKR